MKWTNEDIEKLKSIYSHGMKYCVEVLGRKRESIKSMACRLKITGRLKFTDEEIAYIKTHGNDHPVSQLSRDMKRSWNAVNKIVKKLNISCAFIKNKWIPTEEEKSVMRSGSTYTEIAVKLNRSIPTVIRNMREMSLISPAQKRRFNLDYRARDRSLRSVPTPIVPRDINGEDRIRMALARIGL